MVKEEFVNFVDWIGPALIWFFIVLCICVVVGTLYGFVVAAVRNGPNEAFYVVAGVIAQAPMDLFRTSPRRVMALAKLAVQEAIRRRTLLVVFVIFAVALLVGGWFLDVRSDRPNEIYLSFVMFGTQLLILLTAVMISCFSLPQDIKTRTIYTVVTKPVRSFEIVAGRILGFGLMGTLLLAAMGVISYVFVVTGLQHDHDVELTSFEVVDKDTGLTAGGRRASINAVLEGATTFNSHHRHRVEIMRLEVDPEFDDGKHRFAMVVTPTSAHGHESVVVEGDGRPDYLSEDGVFTFDQPDGYREILDLFSEPDIDQRLRIRTGSSAGYLQSRVPVYANSLRFINREGEATDKGVSVGDEWEYRSYIDGGTSQSRAYFAFTDMRPARFPSGDTIPLELTLGVFRLHKGNIERRVTGSLTFKKVVDGITYESDPRIFESEEFFIQRLDMPRRIQVNWVDEIGTAQSEEMDLFDDFAPDGKFEVWLRCNESGQFFGVARGDLYFRAKENPFWMNFLKCYCGLWLQMLIVIAMGVTFSTYVSGPVSMLGCASLSILMSQVKFINDLANEQLEGGGPLEAVWRIFTQQNLVNDLEGGVALTVVQSVDWVLLNLLNVIATSLPNLPRMNTMESLARGYDINFHDLGTHVVMAAGFCLVVAMVGYFRMKTREIAA